MIEKRFGWWPRNSTVDARATRVDLLATFDKSIAAVKNDPRAYDGWYYPPLEPVRTSSGETKPPPQIPAPIFELPSTHLIVGSEAWMDEDYLHFVIALIGLVDGMRLVPERWQHFYKAPIRSHKLADLVCDSREIAEIVFVAANWWQAHSIDERRAMFAAIHWFCFSGLYHHEFEEFSAKYTVLDTLYWIYRQSFPERIAHSERPYKLASVYGLLTPAWAVVVKNSRGKDSCRLAEIRNDLVHEAKFAGHPIGFAHLPELSLTLELGAFVTRLIIAMLGVQCSYVQSATDTRCNHGIGLTKWHLR
jgi:hypothetical protein